MKRHEMSNLIETESLISNISPIKHEQIYDI